MFGGKKKNSLVDPQGIDLDDAGWGGTHALREQEARSLNISPGSMGGGGRRSSETRGEKHGSGRQGGEKSRKPGKPFLFVAT